MHVLYKHPKRQRSRACGRRHREPTFTPDIDGSYAITLTVNDGTVNSAPDTVIVTASSINSAPVASAGPDQNVATDSLVTLTAAEAATRMETP